MIKRSDGLVGLYPFNERKGSMVHNESNANDTLIIPGIFKPLQRKILYPLWLDFRWNLSFILGMGLSLAIELSQAYLPSRDSSPADGVSSNFAGTILASFFKSSHKTQYPTACGGE
jgi:hypothetical protein